MAIQMRRGNAANYDEDKMLPGEFGVAVDEEELYIAFATGNSKRVLTEDDIVPQTAKRLWTGQCTTLDNVSNKVVLLDDPDSFELVPGVKILVFFTQSNSVDAPKLKIGAYGTAISIAYQSPSSPGLIVMSATNNRYSSWGLGLKLFEYTGTYWVISSPDFRQLECVINSRLTATDQGSGVVALSLT